MGRHRRAGTGNAAADSAIRRVRPSTVALRPAIAAYEGYRTDTARRLVWFTMAILHTRRITAVPVPPLGIDR